MSVRIEDAPKPETTVDDKEAPKGPEVIAEEGPNGSVRVRLAEGSEKPAEEKKPEGGTPELILGKFKSQEDLIAAYTELEKKASKPADKPADKAPEGDAKEAVENAGLDFDSLVTEFQTAGKLSEESLASLEAKGISRQTVDNYVRGQVALAGQLAGQMAEAVGGQESLTGLLEWARTGLPKADIDAYNAVVDSGNVSGALLALRGIQAQHAASVGQEPTLVTGTTVPTVSGVTPFRSNAEVVAAMRDARYASDPAYRATVAKRLEVSDF